MLLKERKLNRLSRYDYSKNGWYFVTICTNIKGNVLGNINNGKMVLNELGGIVEKQWYWLLDKFEYLKYDEWIIMPDHVHGIMVIDKKLIWNGCDEINGRERSRPFRTKIRRCDQFRTKIRRCDQFRTKIRRGDSFPIAQDRKIKSISELIGAFKTTSSKEIHNLGFVDFKWHKSFYDEIIRNEISLDKIRKYIIENPRNFLKAK